MPRDFRWDIPEVPGNSDGRVTGKDCFICGKRIVSSDGRVWVSSPRAGNMKIAAHGDCARALTEIGDQVLVDAYKMGLYAALAGEDEAAH